MAGCKAGLDVRIAQEFSSGRVDGNHLAGGETALFNNLELVELGTADLRGHDEHAVLGDVIASRPKSVAVKAGSGDYAVREGKSGWSIPRLGEAAVVVVEILELLREVRVRAEGWRHEHRHGVKDAAAAHGENLQRIVEAGGVGAARLDDWLEEVDVGTPEIGFQLGLTGMHPIPVAADRVDLAIVGEHAERMGQRPSREGVCAVALVEERDGRLVVGIREVGVELFEGRRNEEALVNNRAVRERRYVEILDLVGSGAVLDFVAG